MKAIDNLSKSIKHLAKKNTPVVVIEKTNYFSLPLFLAGALVGVIAALLFTPDTGENNRRKLKEKFDELNQDKVKFNGRQTYKVREISEDGIKNLEEARANLNDL